MDLVAYRVIEVALRAGADQRLAHGVVTVRYATGGLELEVSGDGSIPGLDDTLQAIAQRVALYDGSLRTASAAGGGFGLRPSSPSEHRSRYNDQGADRRRPKHSSAPASG